MSNKNYAEELKKVEQKINAMKKEKQRLEKLQKNDERKHRDHVKIVVGATFLTHYSEEEKGKLFDEFDDEQIKEWVHSKFRKG